MLTASGRRSGAVYGEKSPKTRLARIYCYGSTLNIVNWINFVSDICVVHRVRRLPSMPFTPVRNSPGLLFFFFLNLLKGALSRIFGISFNSQNICLCRRKS